MDPKQILEDIKQLIADFRAGSYFQVAMDCLSVAADIKQLLGGLTKSRTAMVSAKKFGVDDIGGLVAALESECGATKIDWASVLTLVLTILSKLWPVVVPT